MKTPLWLIFLLSGSMSLVSCRTAAEKVAGVYKWWPHHDTGVTARLGSNHRFKLLWLKGDVLKRGEGTWRIKGRKLILQSDSGQHAELYIRFDQAVWKIRTKNDSVLGVHDGRVLLEKIRE